MGTNAISGDDAKDNRTPKSALLSENDSSFLSMSNHLRCVQPQSFAPRQQVTVSQTENAQNRHPTAPVVCVDPVSD